MMPHADYLLCNSVIRNKDIINIEKLTIMKNSKKYDFTANGLHYTLKGNEAIVIGSVLNDINGYANMVHGIPKCDIIIPEYVAYKGKKYSVTMIGASAFSGCVGIISVTIPETVTKIGRSAFFGCSTITTVKIPNSVAEIGEYAFYGCNHLTKSPA